jgi:two-component system, chemotaxis family, chemotaxis protein CheY
MRTALVVDDATVMRIRLRDIIEPKYQVVAEASNGQEAIELYEKHRPDFVTLDITMQVKNGIEALEEIIDAHPEALIVIVSAVGQKRMVFDAISKGAKDFIIKPFEPERVLASIDRLFD